MQTAEHWIETLKLQPHPEGGRYREVYRSAETIPPEALPPRFDGGRSFSTSIYYLLEGRETSSFHRLKADEVWHFYDGSPLLIHTVGTAGVHSCTTLDGTRCPQAVVPAQHWMAAELADVQGFALVGCAVAPGFDFADFELAERVTMLRLYPQHEELIRRLT